MTGLPRDAMKEFFQQTGSADAALTRERSGLAALLPNGCIVDDALFTPCGYSANALLGEGFVSIHVTPEDHCSFLSFETSVGADADVDAFIARVAETFRPARLTAVLSNSAGDADAAFFAAPSVRARPLALVEANTLLSGRHTRVRKASFAAADAPAPCCAQRADPKVAPVAVSGMASAMPMCAPKRLGPTLEMVGGQFGMRDLRGISLAEGMRALLAAHGGKDDPVYAVDLGRSVL